MKPITPTMSPIKELHPNGRFPEVWFFAAIIIFFLILYFYYGN